MDPSSFQVADVSWWTFASRVVETGLGGGQQQFQVGPPLCFVTHTRFLFI